MRCAMLGFLMLLMTNVAVGDEVEDLRAELERTKAELTKVKAERDEYVSRLVSAFDRIQKQEHQLIELDELRLRFSKRSQLMPDYDLWLIEPLSGVVLAVKDGGKLIELSVGHDDNLQIGQEVTILRDSVSLGNAVIRKVTTTRSVAEIEVSLVPIRKGDYVEWPKNDFGDRRTRREAIERLKQLD